MVAGFAALVLLSQAHGITYSNPGAPLTRLLKDFSEKTGLHWTATADMAADVLVVRFADAPADQVRSKIAEAAGGEWIATKEGFLLRRTKALIAAEEKAELDATAAALEPKLQEARQQVAMLAPWSETQAKGVAAGLAEWGQQKDPDWNKRWQIETGSPSGRALKRLIASFTAQQLAALPDGIRTVYSSKPTAMQRPLSPRQLAIVGDMVDEQRIWEGATKPLFKQPESMTVSMGSLIPDEHSSFQGGLGKALVAVTRDGWLINVKLLATDAKGSHRVNTVDSLNGWDNSIDRRKGGGVKGEEPLAESEILMQLEEAIADYRTRPAVRKPVGKELIEAVYKPETIDPISLFTGDLLLQTARVRNENLVANLTDGAAFTVGFLRGVKPYASWLLRALTLEHTVREGEGWISIRPTMPAETRRNRENRVATGEFLRRIRAEGCATLDARAEFAFRSPGQNLASWIRDIVLSDPETELYDPLTLRFYGSLDAQQRQALRDGARLPYSSFTPMHRELLFKIVYSSDDYAPDSALLFAPELHPLTFVQKEPTEAVPDGLGGASLSITATSSLVAKCVNAGPWGPLNMAGGFMDANMLGLVEYSHERPGVLPWYEKANLNELLFRAADVTKLELKFDLTKSVWALHTLEDKKLRPGEPVAFKDLPSALLDAVAAELARARRDMAEYKGSQDSTKQSVPPPAQRE